VTDGGSAGTLLELAPPAARRRRAAEHDEDAALGLRRHLGDPSSEESSDNSLEERDDQLPSGETNVRDAAAGP